MKVVLPWLLATAGVIVAAGATIYLMLWALAWMLLQPFTGALEILALGMC